MRKKLFPHAGHLTAKTKKITATCVTQKRGAKLHVPDKDGRTPLMVAIMRGHRQVAEIIIRRSMDLTLRRVDNEQKNVFHYAVLKDNVEILEVGRDSFFVQLV